MAIATTAPIEQRLAGMAAEIRQLVPAAEVRLYSCGEACGYGARKPGSLLHQAIREGVRLHGHP